MLQSCTVIAHECKGNVYLQAWNFIFERARPFSFENIKVNGKLLKGHQGKDQGQRRPWLLCPVCYSRPVPLDVGTAEIIISKCGYVFEITPENPEWNMSMHNPWAETQNLGNLFKYPHYFEVKCFSKYFTLSNAALCFLPKAFNCH